MIISPFQGVDGVSFGMRVQDALQRLDAKNSKKINRFSDAETEHLIYGFGKDGKECVKIGLSELKGQSGVQAIAIFKGPAFLMGHEGIDLMSSTRSTIREIIPGEHMENGIQADLFLSVGLSPYFESEEETEIPAMILATSRLYMSLLMEP